MLSKRHIRALFKLRYRQFRNFLFSNKFKEFLFFLIFVFIATVFWLLNALNYNLEDNVTINVNVKNSPDDIMFITPESQQISVRIRDKGTKLINYIFRVRDMSIDIDFEEIKDKEGKTTLPVSDLLASYGMFPQTTSVIAINPDTLFFEYTNSKAIKLPVRINSAVRPDIYHYIKSVTVQPDSVVVYLPIMNTTPYDYVETLLVPQQTLSDTSTIAVQLKEIPGAKLIPEIVEVSYDVDIYVDKTMSIPVTGINFPTGIELKTFPTRVDVSFQIGSDYLKNIKDGDFSVVVDYNTLDLNSEKANVRLDIIPDDVRNVRLVQPQVDYLLEWNSASAGGESD